MKLLVSVALFFIILAGGVYSATLSEEFERDYTIIGSNYGKVAYDYVDSDKDGMADSLAIVGDDGSTLRFIKFETQPSVLWTVKLERAGSFDIASLDLKGSGFKDCFVVGSKDVIAYDALGNEVWKYSLGASVYSIIPLDLNGDGVENEVVTGMWGKIIALSSEGEELWSYEISGRGDKIVPLDTNGDNIKDSIAIALANRIIILNPLGKEKVAISASHFDKNIVVIGSYTGKENISRIVTVEVNGKVKSFDVEGKELWQASVYVDNPDIVKVKSLDYSGSGLDNYIAVFTGFLYLYDEDGNRVWTYSQTIFNDFALADLDSDGFENEFFGCSDKKLYAISKGQQVGYYMEDSKKISPYNRTGANYIAAIDIDGDGSKDDILGVTATDIFVLSHKEKEKPRKRLIVVANSIDYKLATDLFDYLRDAGFEVIHIFPEDFANYKKEKNIVILGGHLAPEGTGEIVSDLLTSEQKAELEQKGAVKIFKFSNIYTLGQRITVLAGNTREETKQAHRLYRGELL